MACIVFLSRHHPTQPCNGRLRYALDTIKSCHVSHMHKRTMKSVHINPDYLGHLSCQKLLKYSVLGCRGMARYQWFKNKLAMLSNFAIIPEPYTSQLCATCWKKMKPLRQWNGKRSRWEESHKLRQCVNSACPYHSHVSSHISAPSWPTHPIDHHEVAEIA